MCPPSPLQEYSAHFIPHPEPDEHQLKDPVIGEFKGVLVIRDYVVPHLI